MTTTSSEPATVSFQPGDAVTYVGEARWGIGPGRPGTRTFTGTRPGEKFIVSTGPDRDGDYLVQCERLSMSGYLHQSILRRYVEPQDNTRPMPAPPDGTRLYITSIAPPGLAAALNARPEPPIGTAVVGGRVRLDVPLDSPSWPDTLVVNSWEELATQAPSTEQVRGAPDLNLVGPLAQHCVGDQVRITHVANVEDVNLVGQVGQLVNAGVRTIIVRVDGMERGVTGVEHVDTDERDRLAQYVRLTSHIEEERTGRARFESNLARIAWRYGQDYSWCSELEEVMESLDIPMPEERITLTLTVDVRARGLRRIDWGDLHNLVRVEPNEEWADGLDSGEITSMDIVHYETVSRHLADEEG